MDLNGSKLISTDFNMEIIRVPKGHPGHDTFLGHPPNQWGNLELGGWDISHGKKKIMSHYTIPHSPILES